MSNKVPDETREADTQTYIFDASAILAVLIGDGDIDELDEVLRSAGTNVGRRVLIPFTALEELELYISRRLPGEVEAVMSLVSSWPAQVVESYPGWRHEALRLQSALDLPRPMAWVAALAMLQGGRLIYQDSAFDAVPGLMGLKIN